MTIKITKEIQKCLDWSKKKAKNEKQEQARMVYSLKSNYYSDEMIIDFLISYYKYTKDQAEEFVKYDYEGLESYENYLIQ